MQVASREHAGRAQLRIELRNGATSEATAAMVQVRDEAGRLMVPEDAPEIAAGGHAWNERVPDAPDGRRSLVAGYFAAEGSAQLSLAPGTYTLSVRKGREFRRFERSIELQSGETQHIPVALERWIDLPARGWHSGDGHLHFARLSPDANETLLTWTRAEDLHVANVLQMQDARRTYFPQYAFGEQGSASKGPHFIVPGLEAPRSRLFGHLTGLRLREAVDLRPQYYDYRAAVATIVAAGGIPVLEHIAFDPRPAALLPATAGMQVRTAGLTHAFLRTMQPYYDWLDLGFELSISAGSDAPWFLTKGPRNRRLSQLGIGHHRVYVQTSAPLDVAKWFDALEAGRTFISYGDFLFLSVNGAPPGSIVDIAHGESVTIQLEAAASPDNRQNSQATIVVDGRVRRQLDLPSNGTTARSELRLTPSRSFWVVGRSTYAHTSATYVRVDGEPWWNEERFEALMQRQLQRLASISSATGPGPALPGIAEDEAAFKAQRPALRSAVAAARAHLEAWTARFRAAHSGEVHEQAHR